LLAKNVGPTTAASIPDTDSGAVPPVAPSKKVGPIPHAIKQSTGASLSQALGNVGRSPAHYATGRPGTVKSNDSSTVNYYKPKWTAPPVTRTVSNPVHGGGLGQNDPPTPVKGLQVTPTGVKMVKSNLVNPKQSTRPILGPEHPAAFWTKR
jgi:hypothetical protein